MLPLHNGFRRTSQLPACTPADAGCLTVQPKETPMNHRSTQRRSLLLTAAAVAALALPQIGIAQSGNVSGQLCCTPRSRTRT